MAAFGKVRYGGAMWPEYGWNANDQGQIERISQAVDKLFPRE